MVAIDNGAGAAGWQPSKGGPRLFQHRADAAATDGVRVDGEPEPLRTSANELARAAMARIGYLRGENPKKRDDALLEIAGYIRRLEWMAERTAGVDASSTSDREPS